MAEDTGHTKEIDRSRTEKSVLVQSDSRSHAEETQCCSSREDSSSDEDTESAPYDGTANMRQQRKFNVVAVAKTAVVMRIQRVFYVMAPTMKKLKVVAAMRDYQMAKQKQTSIPVIQKR